MSGRLRILVVEDDFILSIMMQDALSNAGFDVVGIARNAEQANCIGISATSHLAVMDIRLANGDDGIDTAITLLHASISAASSSRLNPIVRRELAQMLRIRSAGSQNPSRRNLWWEQ